MSAEIQQRPDGVVMDRRGIVQPPSPTSSVLSLPARRSPTPPTPVYDHAERDPLPSLWDTAVLKVSSALSLCGFGLRHPVVVYRSGADPLPEPRASAL